MIFSKLFYRTTSTSNPSLTVTRSLAIGDGHGATSPLTATADNSSTGRQEDMEIKLPPSSLRFQVKIDHLLSDEDTVSRDILLSRSASNPKLFTNRYEEVKRAVFIAAQRAAIIAWQKAVVDACEVTPDQI